MKVGISRLTMVVAIAMLMLAGGSPAVWAADVQTCPALPNYSDFSGVPLCLALNGSATTVSDDITVLRLAPDNAQHVSGSAWFSTQLPVANGFDTTFQFRITHTSDSLPGPADGFAFVIQNSSGTGFGNAARGGAGGAIGYGMPGTGDENGGSAAIPNSLAVEFDTYPNTWDSNANHVAVQSCGTNPNSQNHTTCNLGMNLSPGINLSDEGTHTVKIVYTSPVECNCGGSLQVTLDGAESGLFTGTGIAVSLANLLTLSNGQAWVGFTGSTGAWVENSDILSWTFTPHSTHSITLPTPPNVTTPFGFGPFNFKSTPAVTTSTDNTLTITAIPVNPSDFHANGDPNSPFPNAQCIVFNGTGGNCVEFQVQCTSTSTGGLSTDCQNRKYDSEFATNYDVADPSSIHFPGFLKVEQNCSPTVFSDPTTTNQITAFIVSRQDPTTKGRSGGTGSCWVAVQGLTSTTYPNTDLSIVKVAPPLVRKGTTLSYGIAVLNLGPSLATGVSVTDPIPLPSSMSLVSSAVCITGTSGVSCTTNNSVIPPCTVTSNVVTCQVGNLLPFSLRTLAAAGIQLTFQLTPDNLAPGTIISNTATVQAINTDPRPNNNNSTAKTKVCTNIVGLKCVQ